LTHKRFIEKIGTSGGATKDSIAQNNMFEVLAGNDDNAIWYAMIAQDKLLEEETKRPMLKQADQIFK